MIYRFILIISIFTLIAPICRAETYSRNVEFEWEKIEGAKSYNLELVGDKKTLKFTTTDAIWSGPLVPGVYVMRIRANDHRGVPGVWSAAEEIKVGLETPKITAPIADEKIISDEIKTAEVDFKWLPVGAAEKYSFEIQIKEGEILKQVELSETDIEMDLPVAKEYVWKVKAFGAGFSSDAPAEGSFSLLGQKLDSPVLEKPENEFVRQVRWKDSGRSSHYDYELQRFEVKTGKWKQVSAQLGYKKTDLNFDSKWPGGKYKLSVQSHGYLLPSSERSEMQLQVRNGDRSAEAEAAAKLRQSIDRLTGWYGIASYLVTTVDYQGINYDSANSQLNYSTIGGTGLFGIGYLSAKSPWGFFSSAEISGIAVEGGGNYTYGSLEGNVSYQKKLGARGDLKHLLGLSYKELPETIGRNRSTITQTNLLKTIGPHYGIEYWVALTAKLGFQMNFHVYPSLFKVKTSNEQDISPTFSRQLGILGSYKLQSNGTVLLGYAYRQDQVDYKARPGVGSAVAGDLNSIRISGHYLNLCMEWKL